MMLLLVFLFLAVLGSPVWGLYSTSSPVTQVGEKDWKKEVMQHDGIVIVEFYAPWCGHCKSLAPEYEKAAKTLKGVVKVVAVDATVDGGLAQKHGVQGYPTLKVFGSDKRKPTDYNGQRTSDAIVTEMMKATNQLVKDRKAGKASSSGSGGSSNSKKAPPTGGGSGGGSKKGSAVIELTDTNFNALVMESADHWLVEFYAPWCGHCKNLAPEWEEAAKKLQGSVKLGAVDATVATDLASKYGIKGFPTIKLFSAGKKSKAKDYNGPREAQGIVEYALKTLDDAGVPINIPQVTGPAVFEDSCVKGAAKICVVVTVPHILDSGAKGRNKVIDTVAEAAKSFRGKPIAFVWTEAMAQPELESAIEVNQAYPSVSVISVEKKVFATMRTSWSGKNIAAFLNGILSGSEKKSALSAVPTVVKAATWDGKDAVAPKEEMSLEDIMA